MKKTGAIIVGQGIAGSLVAFMLYRHKIPFVVIDPGFAITSSRIAAGMFTPVTGKRKAVHPMAAQQIPFAIEVYTEIQLLIGTPILHQHDIYQVHNSTAEQEELTGKRENTEFEKYIITDPPVLPGIKQVNGACGITHSGWVDCGMMIKGIGRWLQQTGALIEAEFLYDALHFGNKGMVYQGIECNAIVFCEGYQAINNPFFKNETIIPCKGDLLTVAYDHLVTDHIIKKNGIYLVPAGNGRFRAGATYQWNNNSTQPDEASGKQIEGQLDSMLEHRYTTVGHQSAIRPTTHNREVIAKQHPGHSGMFMLNGLGTRGVLQGPWWAHRLVELLEYSLI